MPTPTTHRSDTSCLHFSLVSDPSFDSAVRTDLQQGKAPSSTVQWRSRALHLFALSGLAVAQPLLGLLGGEPDFWIARNASYVDAIVLALVVVVGIPAFVLGVERVLSLVSEGLGWVFHLLAVGAFVFLIALNVIDTVSGRTMRGLVLIVISLVVASALVYAYARLGGVRDFVSILAVGPFAFVALFLIGLPQLGGTNVDAVDVNITSTDSVVVVVMDEFQLAALKGNDGAVDRSRYPNFARLADISTWYPNATTVHDNTLTAIPAILSGKYPEDGKLAVAADHPVNLFTTLAPTHDMWVNEKVTQLCPATICDARESPGTINRMSALAVDASVVYLHTVVPATLEYRLPAIGTRWGGFVSAEQSDPQLAEGLGQVGSQQAELAALTGSEPRAADYGEFLDALGESDEPTLYYLHVDLPHAPWSYLPSGKRYPYADHIPGSTIQGQWQDDRWYTQQAYQRFSMNAGFSDELLGRTLETMTERNMLDDVLFIVVSDHGENFAVNESRRALTDASLAAVGGIPFFIKYPGQTVGVVDERNVQTIDMLPTVIEALGGSIDTVDGVSLASGELPSSKRFFSNAGTEFTLTLDEYRTLAAEHDFEVAGQLPPGVGFVGAFASAGPRADLNGIRVESLLIAESPGDVTMNTADFFRAFDAEGVYEPVAVPADVRVADGLPEFFAIAVNGTVLTTITAYEVDDNAAKIYGIVPPGSFTDGSNEVEVFGIDGTVDEPILIRFV
jgi:hypothetical protein